MSPFLTSLMEPSDDHVVETNADGFVILPRPGRGEAFNALARQVLNRDDGYVALPRTDGGVGYDAVYVIPTD